MAVTLVTTIKRFEGTAAEMAAMTVTGIPAGSTFYQNDTGLIFQLSAAGAWSEKKSSVTLLGSNAGAREIIVVDNTVGGKVLTVATVGTNTKALITCETAQIRFTLDGTAPTTTVGHLLNPGDILKLDSAADLSSFRAIRTGATSGSLQCTYSV